MFCGHCGTAVDGAKFCPNCGKPVEGRPHRSLIGPLVGAAVAALVVGVIVAVALVGSTETHTSGQVTTTTATRSIPPMSTPDAAALAQRYAAAWTAKNIQLMSDLLAPGYVRKEGDRPLQNRTQALAAYQRQFDTLTIPRYELRGVKITTAPEAARVAADYTIGAASGSTYGQIVFQMRRIGGKLLITRSDVFPGVRTPMPTPPRLGDDTTTTTATSSAGRYADTCTVKAWYSNYSSASYGYIHFKCVDDVRATTVAEALGSDSFNFDEEQAAAKRTPKREELLGQLKGKLARDGWEEIGTASGGEWYQLRFGR